MVGKMYKNNPEDFGVGKMRKGKAGGLGKMMREENAEKKKLQYNELKEEKEK
jgi:hypothetical protein